LTRCNLLFFIQQPYAHNHLSSKVPLLLLLLHAHTPSSRYMAIAEGAQFIGLGEDTKGGASMVDLTHTITANTYYHGKVASTGDMKGTVQVVLASEGLVNGAVLLHDGSQYVAASISVLGGGGREDEDER
jgi:hypothetical protein